MGRRLKGCCSAGWMASLLHLITFDNYAVSVSGNVSFKCKQRLQHCKGVCCVGQSGGEECILLLSRTCQTWCTVTHTPDSLPRTSTCSLEALGSSSESIKKILYTVTKDHNKMVTYLSSIWAGTYSMYLLTHLHKAINSSLAGVPSPPSVAGTLCEIWC